MMTTITQHNRRESETTEYDCSTDDESLRFLMSETDQVDNEDDQDDDIYIMVKCLFVCHEKSTLPPGSLL